MSVDTREKLSLTTVVLHWIVGVGVIVAMIVGFVMAKNELYAIYPIHKSVGALLFIFILWRVVWRIKQGPLTHVGQYSQIENILAKIVVLVMLLGTVLFPLSGMIMSYFGGSGLSFFGLELVAANIGADGKREALNGGIASFARSVHGWLLPIMAIAIILHIIGAYKHHFVDKDGTMKRILGKRVA
ncbi:cytochrome b [Suttonella sp. R2A3]|uniref:cytochrome b n=1 Tax=Suttonella sp. R2A3 TaxID=2908648 RepID=UPI001F386308|nr:cytochrome b [Suttonella sp. R2A3]UJF23649.1 cytochrome b [Suttonella sp. R2A3]